MHYTGTVWRPPYEAGSLLLEVAAGCTHHRCKFCTLYSDLPFRYRLTPLETVEADLREAQQRINDPLARLSAQLQGISPLAGPRRVFLVGANPFALHLDRLEAIARKIREYLPSCESIGCFSRVTDVAQKEDGQLRALRALGFDGLSIGVETGDGEALAFMDKGYGPEDIVRQARRLDQAGIGYNFMYLTGISGRGRGTEGARKSAAVFNRTNPKLIGSSMLTVYPESGLYQEIQAGRWEEEGELEKIEELKTLLEHLEIPVYFATLGASNTVWVEGALPKERDRMVRYLEEVCRSGSEADLRRYRTTLPHL